MCGFFLSSSTAGLRFPDVLRNSLLKMIAVSFLALKNEINFKVLDKILTGTFFTYKKKVKMCQEWDTKK